MCFLSSLKMTVIPFFNLDSSDYCYAHTGRYITFFLRPYVNIYNNIL